MNVNISPFLDYLIIGSWQLLILAPFAWLLSRLSRKAYPRFAYLVWLLVMVKSLLPFQFSLPVSPFPTAMTLDVPQLVVTAGETQKVATGLILFLVWGIGSLVLLTLTISREYRFRRTLDGAERFPDFSMVTEIAQELGLRRKITVLVSENVRTPFTIDLFKSKIYLPAGVQNWSESELRSTLAHELMHIQRYDLLVIYLQSIARILYFFHPVMWLVNDQLDLERERICDDAAISVVNMPRSDYSHSLLKQLEHSLASDRPSVLAGGLLMSKRSVIKRFEYLIQTKGAPMKELRLYHIILLVLLGATMLVMSCAHKEAALAPPAPPESVDDPYFVPYDVPPEPAGGYIALMNNVAYPELAQKAGIEGTVLVQTLIGIDGKASQSSIVQGVPDSGLNESAIAAIEKTAWKAAQQRDQTVAVWITIPVQFRLKETKTEEGAKNQ